MAQVASVWVFATIHQGLIIHTNYVYLVTQYGNRPFLNYIVRGHLVSLNTILARSDLMKRFLLLSGIDASLRKL